MTFGRFRSGRISVVGILREIDLVLRDRSTGLLWTPPAILAIGLFLIPVHPLVQRNGLFDLPKRLDGTEGLRRISHDRIEPLHILLDIFGLLRESNLEVIPGSPSTILTVRPVLSGQSHGAD